MCAGDGGAARRPMLAAARPCRDPKLQSAPDRSELRAAGFLSRRRSQARNSSLSSRSAAFRPARNNRSRSDGSSCAQPAIVALYKSMRAGIRETLEKRSAKNKSPKTKIRNTLKARGRAVPPSVSHAQRTPALSAKAWRGRFRHCICS